MNEIWKPIKDFPNYEVSNFGQVRSLNSRWGIRKISKILKGNLVGRGYFQVILCKDKKLYGIKIHRLVAETFLGSRPENKQVNHKDGNKQNNHVDNLEYVTPKENMKHAYIMGLLPYGEKHHNSKLTNKQVEEIRKLYSTGEYTYMDLSKIYKISYTIIGRIVKKRLWIKLN